MDAKINIRLEQGYQLTEIQGNTKELIFLATQLFIQHENLIPVFNIAIENAEHLLYQRKANEPQEPEPEK